MSTETFIQLLTIITTLFFSGILVGALVAYFCETSKHKPIKKKEKKHAMTAEELRQIIREEAEKMKEEKEANK